MTTKSLNQYQAQVVSSLGKGKIVVDSCPGSGKTFTIQTLIAEMLIAGIDPKKICALTFSNKAASEIRVRVASQIWPDLSEREKAFFSNPFAEDESGQRFFDESWVMADPRRGMIVNWICTIHAVANRILKAQGHRYSILGNKDWEINDLIRDALSELEWDEGVKNIRHWIAIGINNLVEPFDANDFFTSAFQPYGLSLKGSVMGEIYRRYLDFMKSRNMVDFDMLQARLVSLLRKNPTFASQVAGMFDYVIVDEAQDTNSMQMEIIEGLTRKAGNLVMVGDVDQAMYGFRGAKPEVLHEYNATRYVLPINYRSTQNVISTAALLIGNNYTNRPDLLKPFNWRDGVEEGNPIHAMIADDFRAMGEGIIKEINDSEKPENWFILSRTRAECATLHTQLLAAGIPAINKSGGLLFGASHIQKVLAYAKLAVNHNDARNNTEILTEIANVATKNFSSPITRRRHMDNCPSEKKWWEPCGCPIVQEEGIDLTHARFYGAKAIEDAERMLVWHNRKSNEEPLDNIFDAIERYHTRDTKKKLHRLGSTDLVHFVRRLEKLAMTEDAAAVISVIVNDCVLPWIEKKDGVDPSDLSENGIHEDFDVLIALCEPEETLEQYLNRIETFNNMDNPEKEGESVLLGTFHWSKGAERPNVVVNLTRCPIIPPPNKPGHLPMGGSVDTKEERRLAFVGVTRAKDYCVVCQSEEWMGKPAMMSEFIREMGL